MERTRAAAESADFRLRLPCEPASVPEVRARVREWCHKLALHDGLIADVQLALTEAATNAVRHSGCADFETQGWASNATVTVCVLDQGPGRDDPNPGGGMGTNLIRMLADSAEFQNAQPGTRVVMRFDRRAARR